MNVIPESLRILLSELYVVKNPIFEMPHALAGKDYDIIELQTSNEGVRIIRVYNLHESINPL